ncbi:MAG TPA: EthD family reductase [Pseudonocardia sp.]|jgi:uncharacterized protein (TIGR02118 family)|nr:EthD family reductase [Pseudonocardia sp.]
MFQLTALYNHPEDAAAFDRHYDEVHAPIARKIPGLLRYTVSRPGPDADGNPPQYHLVAVLDWESQESFQAGLASSEGEAALADLPNFAGAGVTMLTGPANEI